MKTRNIIQTIFLILLSFNIVCGQTYDYKFAISAVGKGDDRGNKVVTDPNGNVIVCGRFHGAEISFGDIKLMNKVADGSSADAFLVKYDPNGKALWAKSIGGTSNDLGTDCTTDKHGNIIFLASFDSPEILVGKEKIINNTDKDQGGDALILKFSPNGEIIWTKHYGGSSSDGAGTCATDKNGNICIVGEFYSNSMTIEGINLINSGKGSDIFITKLNSDGKLIWTKTIQGPSNNGSRSCSIDLNGDIIISGDIIGATAKIDSITLKKTGEKFCDIFVAKYSPEGKLKWAKSYGGPSMDIANCATDNKGNVILAGMMTDSLLKIGNTTLYNYGKVNLHSTQFPQNKKTNLLLIKLDPNGNELWSKTANGNATAAGIRNFSIDLNGNIIVGGSFEGDTLIIGKNVLLNITSETEDIFIAAYSPEGNVLWAKCSGGAGRNVARSTASDKNGNIYVTGSFENPKLSLGSFALTNSGEPDVFILKLAKTK